jgi:hypothetical protein
MRNEKRQSRQLGFLNWRQIAESLAQLSQVNTSRLPVSEPSRMIGSGSRNRPSRISGRQKVEQNQSIRPQLYLLACPTFCTSEELV